MADAGDSKSWSQDCEELPTSANCDVSPSEVSSLQQRPGAPVCEAELPESKGVAHQFAHQCEGVRLYSDDLLDRALEVFQQLTPRRLQPSDARRILESLQGLVTALTDEPRES